MATVVNALEATVRRPPVASLLQLGTRALPQWTRRLESVGTSVRLIDTKGYLDIVHQEKYVALIATGRAVC